MRKETTHILFHPDGEMEEIASYEGSVKGSFIDGSFAYGVNTGVWYLYYKAWHRTYYTYVPNEYTLKIDLMDL